MEQHQIGQGLDQDTFKQYNISNIVNWRMSYHSKIKIYIVNLRENVLNILIFFTEFRMTFKSPVVILRWNKKHKSL